MDKEKLKAFALKWIFTWAWLIMVVFILFNIWFKPFFNIVLLLFIAGAFYNAWLTEKERYVQKLFLKEDFTPEKSRVFYWAYFAEGLILLASLHFLYKGFTTVTGVTESFFNVAPASVLGAVITSVSFLVSLAVCVGMMIILYLVSNSTKNRQLIITYLILDFFILMPFNFMFSYECNQQENLNLYYANSLPGFHDQLRPHVQKKFEKAKFSFDSMNIKLRNYDSSIARIERSMDETSIKYESRRNTSTNGKDSARYEALRNEVQNTGKKKISAFQDARDNGESSVIKVYYHKAEEEKLKHDSVGNIIKRVNNGSISKKHLPDTVLTMRQLLLELYNSDSILQRDNAIIMSKQRLDVTKEAVTDGFFNMLQGLFCWALKDNTWAAPEDKVITITPAQAEWNAELPKKRWFCFFFALTIDIFPLVIALVVQFWAKRKQKHGT